MTELTQDSAVANVTALLVHYGFELGGYEAEELVAHWLDRYEANWVRLAAIEALYQGRYKSVSVEQILAVWNRRGQALHHFNHEFERLICRKFPQNFTETSTTQTAPAEDLQESADKSQQVGLITSQELVLADTPAPHNEPSSYIFELDVTPVNPDDAREEALADTDKLTEVPPTKSQSVTYKPDWSRWEASKRPIDQFTPAPDVSEFYLKLKAVAQLREDLTRADSFVEQISSTEC